MFPPDFQGCLFPPHANNQPHLCVAWSGEELKQLSVNERGDDTRFCQPSGLHLNLGLTPILQVGVVDTGPHLHAEIYYMSSEEVPCFFLRLLGYGALPLESSEGCKACF